ncbi:hypothetical protein [Sphingopyxis sp. H012]|uniref:hypothetical protein n=1 Tax=Sphingopyxis sp. H012 TaxID=1759065 RepID=UPI001E5E64C1|nr:hypothetical protein [Sphingopyxis sp. H012]
MSLTEIIQFASVCSVTGVSAGQFAVGVRGGKGPDAGVTQFGDEETRLPWQRGDFGRDLVEAVVGHGDAGDAQPGDALAGRYADVQQNGCDAPFEAKQDRSRTAAGRGSAVDGDRLSILRNQAGDERLELSFGDGLLE